MNSSDRSGHDQENQDDAEGWTKVISKSSKRMLRKKQKLQEKKSSERHAHDLHSESRSRSRSASRSRSESRDAAVVSDPEHQEEAPMVADAQGENTEQQQASAGKRVKRSVLLGDETTTT
jgi:hypothetical protein